jgi:hypothetical protein
MLGSGRTPVEEVKGKLGLRFYPYCTYTSAGDGFAAFEEIKVFEIDFLQPAPNQSVS